MPHHAPITFAEAEGHLPDVCLRCGGRATCQVRQTVRLYNSATGYGKPGVFALIRMIVDFSNYFASPTLILRGPFCERHRHHWKVRRTLMWAILAAVPVFLVLALAIFGAGPGPGPVIAFGTVFFGILAAIFVYATMTRSLGCNEEAETLLLGFVHPKFMTALEEQREEAAQKSAQRQKEKPAASVAERVTASPKDLPRTSDSPFANLDDEPCEEAPPKRIRRGNPNNIGVILTIVIGAPLVMLVIVGVLIKIGLVAKALFDRPAPEPVAQENRNEKRVDADRENEPGAVVPKAPAMPPLPAVLAGRPSIDLIPLADPRKDVIHGRWLVSNGALHCNDGGFVPRVQFPYRPPPEYDFVVTFWQPSLGNGISLVMPNPNGGSFFWFLGNHNGKGYGFHANPDKEGRKPSLIKAKTIHTTVVQVRSDSVRASVDGNKLMKLDTNFRDLTCDGWREIRNTSFLAVACDDATVFYHVRVVEVTGKGKLGR